jgi:hypothetical protein
MDLFAEAYLLLQHDAAAQYGGLQHRGCDGSVCKNMNGGLCGISQHTTHAFTG